MNSITKLSSTSFTRCITRIKVPHATTAFAALSSQRRKYTNNTVSNTFQGWACFEKGGKLMKKEFPLTEFGDNSVDMDIICCGICGHEVIGQVTRVGKNVKHLKVGDRAGLGCQCDSCHQCSNCKCHKENLCEQHATWSFNDHWTNGDKTYGGFADKWRGLSDFLVKIPDGLPSADASSILCGGVTTYAPMKRFGVGQGSKVAVLGLGGLGHFGVQWARAMGAQVVAYNVVPEKAIDAKKLGCDDYVLINKPDQLQRHWDSFSHILATKILNKSWDTYFKMMRKNGVFIVCDIPEVPLSGINALQMASKQINIVGSFIGSPTDINETLDFADKHGIYTWANKFSMDNINDAIQFVRDGHPRYRAVLVN